MSRGGAEREGDTESKAGSRLWAVSTEPDAGFKPTNHEIMTWAKVNAQSTEPPRCSQNSEFLSVQLDICWFFTLLPLLHYWTHLVNFYFRCYIFQLLHSYWVSILDSFSLCLLSKTFISIPFRKLHFYLIKHGYNNCIYSLWYFLLLTSVYIRFSSNWWHFLL